MFKRMIVTLVVIAGLYIIGTNTSILSWLGPGSERTVQVTDKTDSIEIETSSITTVVIPSDTNELTAEYDGRGRVTVKKSGNNIHVKAKGALFSIFIFNNDKKLTVYIPEDYHRDLELKVGSGSLNLIGKSEEQPLKLAEVEAEVGSGEIILENLEIEHFEQTVSSGFTKIHSLQAKIGEFDIHSGELDLRNYSGQMDANVSSGLLNIEMNKLIAPVNINVSSGEAQLNLPNDADFILYGKSSSGEISNNLSLVNKSSEKGRIIATHGSGEHEIHLNVSSGNIHIQ